MKVIFNYTIPHTGTHFVMDMQRQGYNPDKWCQVDDEWFGNRFQNGANHENFFDPESLEAKILFNDMWKIAKPDDKITKKDIDLLLIKGHHWHRNTKLEKLLKEDNFISDVKFVSPIRDPFFAIMTRSWQGFYDYGKRIPKNFRPLDQRKREARRIVQTFVDILTIRPDRLYTFTIDGIESRTAEGRMKLMEDMYSFCELKVTPEAREYVSNWRPVNTSAGKSKGAGQEVRYKNVFDKMKSEYLSGNIDYIKDNGFCNFEFEFLQKEDYLKRLLEEAGYENLLWM